MQSTILKYLFSIVILLFIGLANAEFKIKALDPITFESKIDSIGKKVFFWYYSRVNHNKPKRLWKGQPKSYTDSKYSTERETVFVTHGWLSDRKSAACMSIKNGYLHHADYNVIVVDWSAISMNKNYSYAASRVKPVGKFISAYINFLIEKGTKPDNIHLVGHSLGGHVMGFAGHHAKSKVAHVVALDPANPGFTKQKLDGRISTESGKYVEVIHTNAGILGIEQPVGHVDYYPNGGQIMPGCEVDTSGSCSHSRAYYYYSESLRNPEKWYARLCDSNENFLLGKCDDKEMVEFARWTERGIKRSLNKKYYLRTNSKSPYGLGKPGTMPENLTLTEPVTNSQEVTQKLLAV